MGNKIRLSPSDLSNHQRLPELLFFAFQFRFRSRLNFDNLFRFRLSSGNFFLSPIPVWLSSGSFCSHLFRFLLFTFRFSSDSFSHRCTSSKSGTQLSWYIWISFIPNSFPIETTQAASEYCPHFFVQNSQQLLSHLHLQYDQYKFKIKQKQLH